MTNETTPSTMEKKICFGNRLKSQRESLGLEHKDAAAQLRLRESIIIMLENDEYPTDIPVTFMRGYLRSYAKLLQIPESEVNTAVKPLEPHTELSQSSTNGSPNITISFNFDKFKLANIKNFFIKKASYRRSIYPTHFFSLKNFKKLLNIPSFTNFTSSHYLMRLFTYLILLTLIGLVATWYHRPTHTPVASVAPVPTMIVKRPMPILPPPNPFNDMPRPKSSAEIFITSASIDHSVYAEVQNTNQLLTNIGAQFLVAQQNNQELSTSQS